MEPVAMDTVSNEIVATDTVPMATKQAKDTCGGRYNRKRTNVSVPYGTKFSRRIIFAVFTDWLCPQKLSAANIINNVRHG